MSGISKHGPHRLLRVSNADGTKRTVKIIGVRSERARIVALSRFADAWWDELTPSQRSVFQDIIKWGTKELPSINRPAHAPPPGAETM